MGLAFWVLVLIWIQVQWPPRGLLAVVMALVIIGGQTLQKTTMLEPVKLSLIGFLIGIISAAPLYLLVMPRLTGYFQLALLLFPVYCAITYFLHALSPPYQLVFLRIGIVMTLLLNLEPQQV